MRIPFYRKKKYVCFSLHLARHFPPEFKNPLWLLWLVVSHILKLVNLESNQSFCSFTLFTSLLATWTFPPFLNFSQLLPLHYIYVTYVFSRKMCIFWRMIMLLICKKKILGIESEVGWGKLYCGRQLCMEMSVSQWESVIKIQEASSTFIYSWPLHLELLTFQTGPWYSSGSNPREILETSRKVFVDECWTVISYVYKVRVKGEYRTSFRVFQRCFQKFQIWRYKFLFEWTVRFIGFLFHNIFILAHFFTLSWSILKLLPWPTYQMGLSWLPHWIECWHHQEICLQLNP